MGIEAGERPAAQLAFVLAGVLYAVLSKALSAPARSDTVRVP